MLNLTLEALIMAIVTMTIYTIPITIIGVISNKLIGKAFKKVYEIKTQ